MKNFTHKSGSSLLVTLLVMGILLTLTLGLSSLVIREIGQTSDTVEAGKAYYAAEAGIEQALFELSQRLPGYETEPKWTKFGPEDGFQYQYSINNKGDKLPYFPDNEPVFLTPDNATTASFLYSDRPAETYNVLGLNETVTIPLFTDDGQGGFDDVEKFLVQYYVEFDIAEELELAGWRLENFDILRWKLFGNPGKGKNYDQLKTDAISDFYPALTGVGSDPEIQTRALSPACIGSDPNLLTDPSGHYSCIAPVARGYSVDSNGQATVDSADLPQSWSYARECYATEAGPAFAGTDVTERCSIQTFVESHSRNYITLTNVVNPDIVKNGNPLLRPEGMNIYYRVIASPDGPDLVRDFADIKADGFARDGNVRQSIDVKLQMSSFLPVFNFSLYRTDTTSDKDSPEGEKQLLNTSGV